MAVSAETRAEIQAKLRAAAEKYGVPAEIALSVASRESNFDQNARSGAGAIGVMQLMPATAAGLGVDPYDVDQNIDGGVRYLAQMFRSYGDWALALAAYNAGPGNVNKYGGIPPFPETEKYVSWITEAALKLGFRIPPAGVFLAKKPAAGKKAPTVLAKARPKPKSSGSDKAV
jgi:soluble lytic murein transglycosylase-like protein